MEFDGELSDIRLKTKREPGMLRPSGLSFSFLLLSASREFRTIFLCSAVKTEDSRQSPDLLFFSLSRKSTNVRKFYKRIIFFQNEKSLLEVFLKGKCELNCEHVRRDAPREDPFNRQREHSGNSHTASNS